MKTPQRLGTVSRFGQVCLKSCQKLAARLANVKRVILAEWQETAGADRRMVELALNEAEALAWQTRYPHLVFPTLATEKIQEVADWTRRQRAVRGASPRLALAA